MHQVVLLLKEFLVLGVLRMLVDEICVILVLHHLRLVHTVLQVGHTIANTRLLHRIIGRIVRAGPLTLTLGQQLLVLLHDALCQFPA